MWQYVGVENISGEAWHRATAKRIGEAVVKYRRDAGLTAQGLAARCRELGVPIHRSTITKIEGGRSRFDLGELLILAAALDVPPLALIYPGLPDAEVETIPGVVQSSWDAYRWATGMTASLFPPAASVSKGAELVDALLRRWNLFRRLPGLELEKNSDDPIIRDARAYELKLVRDEIKQLNRLIEGVGGFVKAEDA